MISTLFFCLMSATAVPPAPNASAREDDVRKSFVELAAKKDKDGCLKLFLAHIPDTLRTIDADLEGSLKIAESSTTPDRAKIAEMHARAVWGAEIAVEALESPMILDYASSFVGFDAAQGKQFREGQKAFREAMGALKKGDAKTGLEAGRRCLERASPLGDWWGAAMGYDAIAGAQEALGDKEHALEAVANARMIYRGLGLQGDEYGALYRMAKLCKDLGRFARGRAACDSALALATSLDDSEGAKELRDLRDQFAAAK